MTIERSYDNGSINIRIIYIFKTFMDIIKSLLVIKKFLWNIKIYILGHYFPKQLIEYRFKGVYNRKFDWNNPQTFDEKVNWSKLMADTTEWPHLADKYAVRKFVEEKGYADSLVTLYGKWDKVEDIDWSKLPDRFVMKVNNGSGDIIICKDKAHLNIEECKRHFSKLLKKKFGYDMGELHYNKIKPCIIAEELLDAECQAFKSSSLIDYKIFSYDGKPAYIWVSFNRTPHTLDVAVYDTDWKFHPEYSRTTEHFRLYNHELPRPASLDKMLEMASTLSKGFPFVRVDLYEVGNTPYFGEMTFTPGAGYNDVYPEEFQKKLGDLFLIERKS